MTTRLESYCEDLRRATSDAYGSRLISMAIFGSWARGTATPVSDIDILLVAAPLPSGRLKRVSEFEQVETLTEPGRKAIWGREHACPMLSPVIKTPDEVRVGSPLFLDMVDFCIFLADRNEFLKRYLNDLKRRMKVLGTARHRRKGGYFWQYAEHIKHGECISL